MKFQEFDSRKQDLDEVRMGASDLEKFAGGASAAGIKCGFEAELIFRGMSGGGTDYDAEPEPDYSIDRRPDSIDDIVDFFEDGDYNGRREIQNLRDSLSNDYYEWWFEQFSEHWEKIEKSAVRDYIEANDWDWDEKIREHLENMDLSEREISDAMEAGKKQSNITSSSQERREIQENEAYANYAEARDAASEELDELVEDEIFNQRVNWESAREEAEEEFRDSGDGISERDWLRDIGVRSMETITGTYDITWPYWEYPETRGGYSSDEAENLARSLERDIQPIKLGDQEYEADARTGGYHSVRRDYDKNPNLWILEEDGSLEPDDDDDMPVEVVSPPVPLDQFDRVIDEFWSWAEDNDAYSNHTTGFHVGVSLPEGEVDYMKLALFLGDKYVLEKFERDGNRYCESALDKIRRDIKPGDYPAALNLMRDHLIQMASTTLRGNLGHGKYTSINLKGDYVEFRSMGGENYFNMLPEIKNTVKRYAYAMWIASNPDVERKEYAKKLYKLVGRVAPQEQNLVDMFVKYSSGEISKEELKAAGKKQQQIKAAKVAAKSGVKMWWRVSAPSVSYASVEVVGTSQEQALERAIEETPEWSKLKPTQFVIEPIRPYDTSPAAAKSGEPVPAAAGGSGQFTGNWLIKDAVRTIHRFGGIGNNQGDANAFARRWLQQNPDHRAVGAIEVVPEMN